MNIVMYNTSSYSDSTIDTFELLGSKIVSIFYNNIYAQAVSEHSAGKTVSRTDAYKVVTQNYLQHFKVEKLFKKTLSNIYEHFNYYSPVPLLTYSHFVDSVTREFVPTDYWPGLNSTQKDRILGTALEEVYKKMSEHMLSPQGLQRVIDDHDNRNNIIFLQNLMGQILIEERERFYQKFTKPIVGNTSGLTEKLRSDLQKTLVQKKTLTVALIKASAELKIKEKEIEQLTLSNEWLVARAQAAECRAVEADKKMEEFKNVPPALPAPVAVRPVYLEPVEPSRPVTPIQEIEPSIDEIKTILSDFDPFEEVDNDDFSPDKIKQKAKSRMSRCNNIALKPEILGL